MSVTSNSVYDSVIVLDRVTHAAPTSRMTGRPTFPTIYGRPYAEHLDPEHLRQIDEMNRPAQRLRRIVFHPVRSVRRFRARRALPDDVRSELV